METTSGFGYWIRRKRKALGDYEALAARKRRIVRVNLPSMEALSKLLEALQ